MAEMRLKEEDENLEALTCRMGEQIKINAFLKFKQNKAKTNKKSTQHGKDCQFEVKSHIF